MSSEFTDKIEKKWEEVRSDRMKKFDKLLDSINQSSAEEKVLWREIYDNAISDRNYALSLFFSIHPKLMVGEISDHSILGGQMASYLTRMEKSNKQLLELASLISDRVSREDDGTLDGDELFDMIGKDDKKE